MNELALAQSVLAGTYQKCNQVGCKHHARIQTVQPLDFMDHYACYCCAMAVFHMEPGDKHLKRSRYNCDGELL